MSAYVRFLARVFYTLRLLAVLLPCCCRAAAVRRLHNVCGGVCFIMLLCRCHALLCTHSMHCISVWYAHKQSLLGLSTAQRDETVCVFDGRMCAGSSALSPSPWALPCAIDSTAAQQHRGYRGHRTP